MLIYVESKAFPVSLLNCDVAKYMFMLAVVILLNGILFYPSFHDGFWSDRF